MSSKKGLTLVVLLETDECASRILALCDVLSAELLALPTWQREYFTSLVLGHLRGEQFSESAPERSSPCVLTAEKNLWSAMRAVDAFIVADASPRTPTMTAMSWIRSGNLAS